MKACGNLCSRFCDVALTYEYELMSTRQRLRRCRVICNLKNMFNCSSNQNYFRINFNESN